jgi:hypothetical protein
MKWKKIGRIFQSQGERFWNVKHSMMPTVEKLLGDIFRVYISGRDSQNRSLIGFFDIDINQPTKVLKISQKPVISLGELGCFDDNGVTASSIVSFKDKKYFYYVGWRPRSTTRFSLVTGMALSLDKGKTFNRISRAPILRVTNEEPFCILTAPCVIKEENIWKMWYVSGVKWENPDLPKYNIKYAQSENGIEWKQNLAVCIDAEAEDETALARPCVIKNNGLYEMWYSYKRGGNTYRMGYAQSQDGVKWQRMDDKVGIDISEGQGWDSEMIEYPFVIEHKGKKYMFYNGNGYGESGVGLAVLED